MKKLIVVYEKTTSQKANQVSEYFSMQHNYGLYDFDADKILHDVCNLYTLSLLSVDIPYYTLIDENNEVITAMFSEEYV